MIKKLLEKWSCLHKWETLREVSCYSPKNPEGRPIGWTLTMVCTKCGKIKNLRYD